MGGAAAAFRSWSATGPVQYATRPVTRGDLTVTVSATGALEPMTTVDVGIEVSGTVTSVEVDYNDTVETDQALARLDTSKLDAQLLQSEAALASARAKLELARATVREAEAQMARLEEVQRASGGKLPSKLELEAQEATMERAHADEAAAKAAVAQAEATRDAYRSDLAKSVVRSPINGIVLERAVEPGQTVAASFQSPVLFTLAEDLSQMELQVDVDEADVGMVAAGQSAVFTVDAFPDDSFPATVTKVRYGSETVEGVVTYMAELEVDNTDLRLRPGMTATASITVQERRDALLVPNAALRFSPPQAEAEREEGGGDRSLLGSIMPRPPAQEEIPREEPATNGGAQSVYVLAEGRLSPVTVTRGLTDGQLTEVLEGPLEEGMALVTEQLAPR